MTSQTLIIFHKQLGDTLLLEPTLHRLNQDSHTVHIRTRPLFADLIHLFEGVEFPHHYLYRNYENMICFDTETRSLWPSIYVPAHRKKLITSTPRKIKWIHKFIFNECNHEPAKEEYRAAYYYRQYFGNLDGFRPPRLNTPPPNWKKESLPEKYLLIHPTSAWKRKCWDTKNWVSLINSIVKHRPDKKIVITGGISDWEKEHVDKIVEQLAQPTIHLGGNTSLRELFWILSHAQAVITVDGAASHIASAFQRPSLTLFGPTHHVDWHWPTEINHMLSRERSHQEKSFYGLKFEPDEVYHAFESKILPLL